MAKTSVNHSSWTHATGKVSSTVNEISSVPYMTFNKTDLYPFTQFNQLISKLNQSIKTLKSYTETDVKNMNNAAQNKINDDRSEAANTRSKLR